jgi:SAM-dependent methyltransferase
MNLLDSDNDAFELNRLNWDERVEAHFNSPMYRQHLQALRAGSHCLDSEHVERMGDVAGGKLLQLQCHMGMETLSWARLGAEVTGVDFSMPAVERAIELSRSLGIPAKFVCANVYDTPKVISGQFDVVFVSVGAICWLPDIVRWASVVSAMLKPGGKLYLDEVHPFADVLADDPTGRLLIAKYAYFNDTGRRTDEDGTYADPDGRFQHNVAVMWTHTIGSVINALTCQGMVIRSLDETSRCVWPRFKQMIEINPNLYELPEPLTGKLPMMYTLVAEKGGIGR